MKIGQYISIIMLLYSPAFCHSFKQISTRRKARLSVVMDLQYLPFPSDTILTGNVLSFVMLGTTSFIAYKSIQMSKKIETITETMEVITETMETNMKKTEQALTELKTDVKEVQTKQNYLYAGFAIAVALIAGFNSVLEVVKNLAAFEQQAIQKEKLREEAAEEKKKAQEAAEFEIFKKNRNIQMKSK